MAQVDEDLTFRHAGQGDLADLLALYRHLNPADPPLGPAAAGAILERIGRCEGSAVVLGLRAEVIATTCTLMVLPNLTRGGAPYGLIENVITDPRFRRRGYGTAVLREAVALAWRHDCYKVMLLTGSKDPATIRFYGDAGFEPSKTGFQLRRIPPRGSP